MYSLQIYDPTFYFSQFAFKGFTEVKFFGDQHRHDDQYEHREQQKNRGRNSVVYPKLWYAAKNIANVNNSKKSYT